MRRKYYYIIIIISTIISVGAMDYDSKIKADNSAVNYSINSSIVSAKYDGNNKKIEIVPKVQNVPSKEAKISNDQQPKQSIKKNELSSESKPSNSGTQTKGKGSETDNSESTSIPNVSEAYIPSAEDLNETDVTESYVQVFKVNREDIIKDMSLFDKEKLLIIASKLSSSDYKEIQNLLESDTDGLGIIQSLRLLKEKLSNSDYQKLREIANKFINMDLVEDK